MKTVASYPSCLLDCLFPSLLLVSGFIRFPLWNHHTTIIAWLLGTVIVTPITIIAGIAVVFFHGQWHAGLG